MDIDGSCHCSAIRYSATIDPMRVAVCHCKDCQTLTGSPFRVTALCARENLRLAGVAPKVYVKAGNSGRKREMHFCGTCGAPVFSSGENGTGEWGIRWGSIHQREMLQPVRQIWCSSAAPWLNEVPALPDGGNP